MLSHVGLPGGVQRRIGAVAVEHLQLNGGVARPIEQCLVGIPCVGADGGDVPCAIGILPLGGAFGEEETKSGLIGHLGLLVSRFDVFPEWIVEADVDRVTVLPVRFDGFPEDIVEALVVGIAILNDECLNALRMSRR